jgi:ABC-type dipeptide/oligopeptide/nickel transport system permease subunit/predicted ABC-type transport system involved in lysophospholipase L1 biosynthesis ATPase subunit
MRNIKRLLVRIRTWFESLKPGSGEEILSWDFGTFSEEPGAGPGRRACPEPGRRAEYNHRSFAPSEEVERLSITVAPGPSSGRDVLGVVRRELRQETGPVLGIFHLSQTVPTDEGPVEVLQGFSLQVGRGEFVSILDSTPGVGQIGNLSYLLSLIGGLSRPTRGAVYLDGQEVWQLPAWKRSRLRREKVSFLFREPKLLPHLSVLENVLMPLEHARPERSRRIGMSWREKRRRAQESLAQVGLEDRLHCRPDELTLAEQQRVALARALVTSPAIILADDPTEGLDGDEARRFVALLREQCRPHASSGQFPLSVVLATQEPELAQATGRVVELSVGQVANPSASPSTVLRARLKTSLSYRPSWEQQSAGDFLYELYEAEFGDLARPLARVFDLVVRPLLFTLAVAVVITYLCFFGLRMAARGQGGLSSEVWRVAGESAVDASHYLARAAQGDLGVTQRPMRTWFWVYEKETTVAELLGRSLDKSLVLLFVAVALGGLIGVPLGIVAAAVRRSHLSLTFIVLSIAGISIPSFFMAFLLQILEIKFCRYTGRALLPLGGFGWDGHIVLPALVLAARPIAQVARVSFVALTEVLDADYVRTARAKGLRARLVLIRHALPNAGVPILTALGTSLRFSLSSLPVVEVIFTWPGLGLVLLQAVQQYQAETAAATILCLGLLFIVVNMGLERIYRVVDPRLREEQGRLAGGRNWLESLSWAWYGLQEVPERLAEWLPWGKEGKEKAGLPPLPNSRGRRGEPTPEELQRAAAIRHERRRAWRQSTLGSLPFTLGGLIVLALVAVFIFGPAWAPHNPYNSQPLSYVNGQVIVPPFAPSDTYPLGSDAQGRDILSLILVGARRTLMLGFFAVLARLVVGTVLGCLAGWFANSALDRFLLSVVEVIAAFPALLLAMVLIYALGIRQGLWVFVVALCAVGWGEPLQFVRSQVMSIREKDYIEGAWATGLGDLQILVRHVLPNLLPSLVVLAFLDMGGVLMLLGELGFLGVFIGGGFAAGGGERATTVYFDVPEWGVILSNTWRGFRSHPWMSFYPAMALTVAILGVNLFGEGLRRLTERLTLNLNRLFNRYTLASATAMVAVFVLSMEAVGPWAAYTSQAKAFDARRAMADIQYLAGPELNGRLTGTADLDTAADYIATRFKELGLQTAGESTTYFQGIQRSYRDLAALPELTFKDPIGQPIAELKYGRDFVESPDHLLETYQVRGNVVYVGLTPDTDIWPSTGTALSGAGGMIDPFTLGDKMVLYSGEIIPGALRRIEIGVLLIVRSQEELSYRQLPALHAQAGGVWYRQIRIPCIYISPAVAERLLAPTGYTLAELDERQARLGNREGFSLETGIQGELGLEADVQREMETRNVIGFLPGMDVEMDEEAIIVMAHYDGLGRAPAGPEQGRRDGTLYPGANDNASGVAMMLEIARIWQEQDFRPKRTVIFVAWAGAERRLTPDIDRFLRAKRGFIGAYRVAAIVELIGVGAGEEDKILLDRSTSDRLTKLFQGAAKRLGVEATTRGRGIHDDYSLYPYPDGKLAQITLTWEGSGVRAHTPEDTVENIDPEKLSKMGQAAALGLMVLARETNY